jgi:anti-sigma regulatory factor (Ser/Thr protein kinase)
MLELSLHILDIVQNSIAAGANVVVIDIEEDLQNDYLIIQIRDNGRGIPKEDLVKVSDPFFTTRKTRGVGFGLALLQQAASQSDGFLEIESEEGKGTMIKASFKHSHMDRMPLGNISKTMSVLIIGNPKIDFMYYHRVAGQEFTFDTHTLREYLDGIPLNDHNVVSFVLQEFQDWMMKRNRTLREEGHES